jgi:hypothetical protein
MSGMIETRLSEPFHHTSDPWPEKPMDGTAWLKPIEGTLRQIGESSRPDLSQEGIHGTVEFHARSRKRNPIEVPGRRDA